MMRFVIALFTIVLFWTAGLACSADSGSTGPTSAVSEISAETLLSHPPAGAIVLDVRSEREYASGHVPNARNIPHTELASRLNELGDARDEPVIVYCESGRRAAVAADVLQEAGYTDVRHLAGDMAGWRAAGRPTQ